MITSFQSLCQFAKGLHLGVTILKFRRRGEGESKLIECSRNGINQLSNCFQFNSLYNKANLVH